MRRSLLPRRGRPSILPQSRRRSRHCVQDEFTDTLLNSDRSIGIPSTHSHLYDPILPQRTGPSKRSPCVYHLCSLLSRPEIAHCRVQPIPPIRPDHSSLPVDPHPTSLPVQPISPSRRRLRPLSDPSRATDRPPCPDGYRGQQEEAHSRLRAPSLRNPDKAESARPTSHTSPQSPSYPALESRTSGQPS